MKVRFLAYALPALIMVVSCDTVHEFPEPGKEVDPTVITTEVKIACKIKFSGIKVVTKEASFQGSDDSEAEKYDRRFFVEVRSAEYADTLVEFHTVFRPVSDTSALTIETSLQARKYNIYSWMDYVLKDTGEDRFYNTGNGENLSGIRILPKEKYIAGTDFKDVQSFMAPLDLTPYADEWYVDITIPVDMDRPVAKITLLADDLDKYAESIGSALPLEELAEGMNLSFTYNGYLPSGYNLYTGRLNDSSVGYGFLHGASYPYLFQGENLTKVGSDYVFVNGESSSVTISAVIRDPNGRVVNQVDNIVVPIEKGKETVLKYHFFTKEYVPGIGINADFDGEFNIYV